MPPSRLFAAWRAVRARRTRPAGQSRQTARSQRERRRSRERDKLPPIDRRTFLNVAMVCAAVRSKGLTPTCDCRAEAAALALQRSLMQ